MTEGKERAPVATFKELGKCVAKVRELYYSFSAEGEGVHSVPEADSDEFLANVEQFEALIEKFISELPSEKKLNSSEELESLVRRASDYVEEVRNLASNIMASLGRDLSQLNERGNAVRSYLGVNFKDAGGRKVRREDSFIKRKG